jgi:hypothetical protein
MQTRVPKVPRLIKQKAPDILKNTLVIQTTTKNAKSCMHAMYVIRQPV